MGYEVITMGWEKDIEELLKKAEQTVIDVDMNELN